MDELDIVELVATTELMLLDGEPNVVGSCGQRSPAGTLSGSDMWT
ncbi:hypothetical protein [Lentzea roselyniae]